MEELIKRVQEQLDNNWAVDKKDIQQLVNNYIMVDEYIDIVCNPVHCETQEIESIIISGNNITVKRIEK